MGGGGVGGCIGGEGWMGRGGGTGAGGGGVMLHSGLECFYRVACLQSSMSDYFQDLPVSIDHHVNKHIVSLDFWALF